MIWSLRRRGPLADAFPPADGGVLPINRRPSTLVARALPWLSVMVASVLASLAWIASAPIVPPLGLLMLIAWRQLRPGLLPVWAGLPLGLFDDLYSGQPLGSAVLIWSAVMLAQELVDARLPWRTLLLDWLLAATLIAAAALLAAFAADFATFSRSDPPTLPLLAPQILVAALLYPLAARAVAACDRLRLIAFLPVGEQPWS